MTSSRFSQARKWVCHWILAAFFLAALESQSTAGTYSTSFTNSENPISEGGNWINGGDVGLDWSNCVTSGGVVHGRQNNGGGPSYNDSTALLAGTWGTNQSVTVTFFKSSVVENDYPEVEIRLRSALSAHSCTGYEIVWSLRTDPSCYIAIVRWNGPFGDFSNVASASGSRYVITNGSTLKASIRGSTITAYVNEIPVLVGADTTYATGNPGIGFDHNGPGSEDAGFGFSTFTATDSFGSGPSPPQNVHAGP